MIIAKHRNGGLDNIRLRFIANLAKFADVDGYNFNNDFNGGSTEARAIPANNSFLDSGATTITVASKMNDDFGDDEDFTFTGGEESPF